MSSSISLTPKRPIPGEEWDAFCDEHGLLFTSDRGDVLEYYDGGYGRTHIDFQKEGGQIEVVIGFYRADLARRAAKLARLIESRWPMATTRCQPEFETLFSPIEKNDPSDVASFGFPSRGMESRV